jgi:hypothetical protein
MAEQASNGQNIENDDCSAASLSLIFSNSESFTSKGSTPKIQNKLEKQKFDFIYKKSIFRHISGFYKDKFIQFTNNKKVHQNKLI